MPKHEACGKSYGAAMVACGGRWQHVISLLEDMCDHSWPPDEIHFQRAVAACRSWEWLVRLLVSARRQELDIGIAAYDMALTTFRKQSEWAVALVCLASMPSPDATNCATVILAMGEAHEWPRALALAHNMLGSMGIRAANAAITACHRGSQWQQAVLMLEHVRQHARPDASWTALSLTLKTWWPS